MSARLTLSVSEAAVALGLGRGLTYSLVREGRLPSVRLGSRILIPRAALESFLAAQPDPRAPDATA
ncbi:MAG: helix-turn-helix domain-containing protein [Actinomycetota bacterium]